tara:strand:- start:356 stop:727 length:372 start_codon:yes stop_codon:yes gene_type:complete
MANPNIVNVSTINGKTVFQAIGTGQVQILENPESSGKILKLNSLVISNVDGTDSADVTAIVHNQDDLGGTGYHLAKTITVPADATLILIDKSTSIYLTEDMSLGLSASAASDLEAILSYEEIS